MISDCHNPRRMANRSQNCAFLLPGVNASKYIDRAVVYLDSKSISFSIGASLERVLNLLAQLFRIDFPRHHANLIDDPDHALEAQNRFLRVLALAP